MDDDRPPEDLNHNFRRRLDAARIVNLDKGTDTADPQHAGSK